MKYTRFLNRRIFSSTRSARVSIRLSLLVVVIWCLAIILLNRNVNLFQWLILDVESLRALFGSLFQGLASFFAIVISVSLLVTQLAYGSFSPRLMPNFLRDRTFLMVVFLFIGALGLNLVILLLLTEGTVSNLILLIVLDLIVSLAALISVIPASFELLNSAHPMKIGWKLTERFNKDYFIEIPFAGNTLTDESLPMLQTLIVKAIRDADSDYARCLLGSFKAKVEAHLNDENAVLYAGYFDSFFKKIAFVASEENEEGVLQQLVFANEALEKKVSKSKPYLSSSDMRSEGSFARNILYIIELSIKHRHTQVIGRAHGAMYRLREAVLASMPPDDEISTFRTFNHFRNNKVGGRVDNKDIHYSNARIFEYINGVYFQSNSVLATEAMRLNNPEATRGFIRDIFHSRHALEKLDKSKHKEVIKRIAYADFFNLSELSHLSLKNSVSISDEVAVGIQEAIHFFLEIEVNLVESYIDLLGQLMIETTEREIPNADPTSMFYWAGVAFRMVLHPAPIHLPIKILEYFEKVLVILKNRQLKSSSPILEKMKKTICEEIVSVQNYQDTDNRIVQKTEDILAQYPEVTYKK